MEKSLHDLLPTDWEAHQPDSFRDLLNADYDGLDSKARSMRALLVDAIHGFERVPVTTAATCREQLERRLIPRRKNRWDVVALNAHRERIYVNRNGSNGSGGLRLLALSPRDKFPTVDSASSQAPLPKNGVYIAIFGGPVDVLQDADTYSRFARFAAVHPVADVVCFDESGDSAIFWSVAAGVGAVGANEISFPDPTSMNEWSKLLCTN